MCSFRGLSLGPFANDKGVSWWLGRACLARFVPSAVLFCIVSTLLLLLFGSGSPEHTSRRRAWGIWGPMSYNCVSHIGMSSDEQVSTHRSDKVRVGRFGACVVDVRRGRRKCDQAGLYFFGNDMFDYII